MKYSPAYSIDMMFESISEINMFFVLRLLNYTWRYISKGSVNRQWVQGPLLLLVQR